MRKDDSTKLLVFRFNSSRVGYTPIHDISTVGAQWKIQIREIASAVVTVLNKLTWKPVEAVVSPHIFQVKYHDQHGWKANDCDWDSIDLEVFLWWDTRNAYTHWKHNYLLKSQIMNNWLCSHNYWQILHVERNGLLSLTTLLQQ